MGQIAFETLRGTSEFPGSYRSSRRQAGGGGSRGNLTYGQKAAQSQTKIGKVGDGEARCLCLVRRPRPLVTYWDSEKRAEWEKQEETRKRLEEKDRWKEEAKWFKRLNAALKSSILIYPAPEPIAEPDGGRRL